MPPRWSCWVVFDSPDDYPGRFVARMFVAEGGEPTPTPRAVFGSTLAEVRAQIPAGLYALPRFADDHQSVVEVWL